MKKAIAIGLMLLLCSPAFGAKYLVVGSGDAGADNGLIVELAADGTSVAGTMPTPAGPPNSTFPVYNPGNGILLYGAARPGTVGVFDFADYVANGTTTVTNYAYLAGGGLLDSEAAPDANSGKFLVGERGGNSSMLTFDPTDGSWTVGASHTMGIPESTFIYGGNVYSIEETSNCWVTPLLGDGTTAGAMVNSFNTSGTVGIPNSQGGYSEFVTAVAASDGTCYLTNLSPNVYEFDLTNPAGGVTNSVNLTTVFPNADRVTGACLDEAAGLLYVAGAESGGTLDFVGAIDVSTWTVTKILSEADGDTVVSSYAYGLAFADLGGGEEVIPEPAGLGVVGLALLAIRKRRS